MSTEHTDKQLQDWYRADAQASTRCPSAQALAALAGGRGRFWQRGSLTRHLAECPHCAQDYQVLKRVQPGLESALQGAGLTDAQQRPGWGLAFASVIGVAAISALLLTQIGGPRLTSSDEVVDAQPAPVDHVGDIFGGEFESTQMLASHQPDALFSGDFDTGPQSESALFTDEFDG